MNKFKSLLLGGAAVAIAATGAQAADAPMGREPVYRCDITGFIELPGTDVCFKVGGFARLIVWAANEDAGSQETVFGGDDVGMYGQGRLNFDARRSTDHGTVRAFIEIQASDNATNTGGAMQLRHAFAQLGNWVFGKTWSTYLHGASDPNGSDLSFLAHTIRISQIRYTQSVGNGLTMSIALEDHEYEESSAVNNGGSGENNIPTIVANINYSNGGYDAQLSGVVKFNEFGPVDGGDDTGFGIMFGLGAELTETVNAFIKVNYTDSNPHYQFDWFTGGTNTGDDHEQFGVMGGISAALTDKLTGQVVGFWGDSDSTGSTSIAAGSRLDREIFGAGVLAQYRVASGFDFLAEVYWRGTDFNAADTAFATGDTDEVIGVFQARASF